MASFNTLRSITLRLNELSNQLSSGKLSEEELEEFEILSRRLYERAVILNYKAKEESVYGKNTDQTKTEASSSAMEFDKAEETGEQAFEINEDIAEVEEKPSLEKESEKESEVTPADINEQFEDRIQFDFSDDSESLETEPISQAEPQITEDEVVRNEQFEEVTAPTSVEASENINERTSSFYELFSKAHKATVGDILGTSKIDSLKGVIGLNDKLQFINELFGNNADFYNKTINALDQLESNDEALIKLSEIAAEENWQEDSSIVNEFVHLINRRYVD